MRSTAVVLAKGSRTGRYLRELGYTDWVDVDSVQSDGVVRNEAGKAWRGYNLYAPRTHNRAFLLDMNGDVAHQWYARELPGSWQNVKMTADGDLLVLDKDAYVARLSFDSEVRWVHPLRSHHDLALLPDGRVVCIARGRRDVDLGDGKVRPIVDDALVLLDGQTGDELDRVWISSLFGDRVPAERRAAIDDACGFWWSWRGEPEVDAMDVFHTNSVEVSHRAVAGVCEPGDLLLSVRELDLVAFLDLATRTVRWTWGPGTLQGQHQPTLTDEGTLLIFDNGIDREQSRVIEVDPARGEVVWRYGGGQPDQPLRSYRRGGCQELPNGDVLIVESSAGHVFEVTRAGEKVWDFYSPFRDANDHQRGAVFRMERYAPEEVEPLLDAASSRAVSARR